MQKNFQNPHFLFFLTTIFFGIGLFAKGYQQRVLVHLQKQAAVMSDSKHPLLRRIRAKYEHACMAREKVENVAVFVEKHLQEYKAGLFSIHTLQQTIKNCLLFSIMGTLASILSISCGKATESAWLYVVLGAGEVFLLALLEQLSDPGYRLGCIKNYMLDYLENVCDARKYRQGLRCEKNTAERKGNEARKEETRTLQGKKEKEARIRQVLEEFLFDYKGEI